MLSLHLLLHHLLPLSLAAVLNGVLTGVSFVLTSYRALEVTVKPHHEAVRYLPGHSMHAPCIEAIDGQV